MYWSPIRLIYLPAFYYFTRTRADFSLGFGACRSDAMLSRYYVFSIAARSGPCRRFPRLAAAPPPPSIPATRGNDDGRDDRAHGLSRRRKEPMLYLSSLRHADDAAATSSFRARAAGRRQMPLSPSRYGRMRYRHFSLRMAASAAASHDIAG